MQLQAVSAGSYLSEAQNPGSFLLQPKIYFFSFSFLQSDARCHLKKTI